MSGENGPTPSLPAGLQIGHRIVLTIEDIAFGGEGVARTNDFVVFVPFVIAGEEVEVEITDIRKRFARGKLVRVIKGSAERVEPLCPYFGECGGCQYQHISYPKQLQIKHKQIVDLFERIGKEFGGRRESGVTELVAPVVPCPQPYGYRNRVMIRSQWDKFKQGLNIGFIRTDNRLVVDIEECKIAEPAINEEIRRVRQDSAKVFPKGGIKTVLRIPAEGWVVPRDSFFQNNFFLLPKLVETVRDRVLRSQVRFLIDAYCGVGFFSLELADMVEWFVGLELDAQAIKAARQNAANRKRANGEFVVGTVEEYLPNILARFSANETTILLDPPRTGCPAGILELLRQIRPKQVIYVSCHPATLARDLNVLCAGGVFELARVVPLDMFPQTQHVECVADARAADSSMSSLS
ncbi:MAG TPA: class I SAM-dependent RNA methyltransferase [Candidatus Binatia bacterium]|nr:class I SAM-dependent RNA methyltransferase [Candidatus Binatia bacterium]